MSRILAISSMVLIAVIYSCETKTNQTEEVMQRESNFSLPFDVDASSFMMKMQKEALKEPYSGIFASTGHHSNLYPIKSTGVSTEPIVVAAMEFLGALSPGQRKKTTYPVQDDQWRKWSNVDHGIYEREGISIKEMNKDQRLLAFNLMQESLSVKGLQLSRNIMKTDQTLREINNDNPIYDEDLYYFTMMGDPSFTEPWGWQIDGHHLIINFFILGDQVVMTPTFMGGEPIITTSGKYKGNKLFQDEQNLGLEFVTSLSSQQQESAIIFSEKGGNNAVGEAFKDNMTLDYQGIRGGVLGMKQKAVLIGLINQYIANMEEEHAKVKMEEIEQHIDSTYFAWIGGLEEDAVFYYRIHSPVVLIEFDHQAPVGVRVEGKRGASRNHIHTVVRTPGGNDYGKDLLRQHLEAHHD